MLIPYEYESGMERHRILVTAEQEKQLAEWDGRGDPFQYLNAKANEQLYDVELKIAERKQDGFVVKDSGKRKQWETGMQRDTNEGKARYDLVLDGPMFKRWAEQLRKGAEKYSERNWMQARTEDEYQRFRESAVRHFFQWLNGDTDEDHAAATFFNINGAEYVRERQENKNA